MAKRLKELILKNKLATSIFTPLWHIFKRWTTGFKTVKGLPGKIHYNDIFDPNNLEHYKSVSFDSLKNIEESIVASDEKSSSSNESDQSIWEPIKNCLVFPSGYGRETRMIVTKLAPENVTCSDTNRRAIDFCKTQFKVKTLLSTENLNSVVFPDKYSLIWCGSLFTHLPEERFRKLLTLLSNALTEKGILVFTTHEKESFNRLEHYDATFPNTEEKIKSLIERYENNEFIFQPYDWVANYGISICTKEYTINLVKEIAPGFRLIRYKSKGWDNHQSVFTFQKSE